MPPPSNLGECQRELELTKQQLEIQTKYNEEMRRKIYDSDRAPNANARQLQQHVTALSQELEERRWSLREIRLPFSKRASPVVLHFDAAVLALPHDRERPSFEQ